MPLGSGRVVSAVTLAELDPGGGGDCALAGPGASAAAAAARPIAVMRTLRFIPAAPQNTPSDATARRALFFYDLGSPYACRRAAERGLLPLSWPSPWPNNGLYAMRAAAALDSREFALSAFRVHFTRGLALSEPQNVDLAAQEVGRTLSCTRSGCGRTPTAPCRSAS